MSHMTVVVTQLIEPRFIEKAAADLNHRVEIQARQGFNIERVQFNWDGKRYVASADTDHVRAENVHSLAKKLSQRYAYHATRETLAEKGFDLVTEETEKTGAIRLTLRRIA